MILEPGDKLSPVSLISVMLLKKTVLWVNFQDMFCSHPDSEEVGNGMGQDELTLSPYNSARSKELTTDQRLLPTPRKRRAFLI